MRTRAKVTFNYCWYVDYGFSPNIDSISSPRCKETFSQDSQVVVYIPISDIVFPTCA